MHSRKRKLQNPAPNPRRKNNLDAFSMDIRTVCIFCYIFSTSIVCAQNISENVGYQSQVLKNSWLQRETPVSLTTTLSAILQQRQHSILPLVWSYIPSLDITDRYKSYIQKFSLSCEISAVHMILESLDIIRSEISIYDEILHFPGSLSWGIWGDPDREFVWYITGSQRGATGYGIYAPPLARYVEGLWLSTEILSKEQHTKKLGPHEELIYLLDQIHNTSHVILWGDWCTNEEYEDGIVSKITWYWVEKWIPFSAKNPCSRPSDERIMTWKTNGEKIISGLAGEHTFLLLGYIWPHDFPTHIIVWDTYTGRHIFPYNEWMRKWQLMDYRALRIWRETK